jgi:hypothetical protein
MSEQPPRVCSVNDEEPTRDQLAEARAALMKLWHTRGKINPNRLIENFHEARLHSVSGLAAHAYRTGEVADRLVRDGLWLEASPVIRTSYECAVTAQWAAQTPDGVQALLNEDYRSRRNMVHALRQSEAWAAAGLEVPEPDDESHESFSNAQARNFKQMCDDLAPGGVEAYSYYKTLCWFSHATNYVIDRYTDLVESDKTYELRLRRTPRASEELAHTVEYFCAVSLVWAASALDFLDAEHLHASQIEALAARVGVTPSLRLTDRARARTRGDVTAD